MPDVRVVLKIGTDRKIVYKDAKATINSQWVLLVTKSDGEHIAQFHSDAYYYWEQIGAGTEEA